MTLEELKTSDRAFVTVYDVAPIIECDPQKLRDALDIDDERPVEMRRFPFPHCKVGNRRKISRDGFLRWIRGDLNRIRGDLDPAAVIFRMKNGGGAN